MKMSKSVSKKGLKTIHPYPQSLPRGPGCSSGKQNPWLSGRVWYLRGFGGGYAAVICMFSFVSITTRDHHHRSPTTIRAL